MPGVPGAGRAVIGRWHEWSLVGLVCYIARALWRMVMREPEADTPAIPRRRV